MSPISRYMSGVTRPRDLRVISKSRGGHFDRLKSDQSADPNTSLLESVPGSFRASDSPQVLQSSLEDPCAAVDTTQWPWQPLQTQKSVQGFEGRTELCEMDPTPPKNEEVHSFGNVRPRGIPFSHTNASPSARSAPRLSPAPQQTRGFHTSSRVPYDSSSYNVTDVPDFFVKYKQHRGTSSTDLKVHERQELGLMPSLSDSILSGDVVASTRRLKAKIPVEHHIAEGHIIHPSGFIVPGPGHISTSDVARAKERVRNEKNDHAIQTAAVARRVLESGFEQVDATTIPSLHKVPFEVHEPDGTVRHPSGFVPPTPAHKFRHTVSRVRRPSPPLGVLRAMHTTSAAKPSGDV